MGVPAATQDFTDTDLLDDILDDTPGASPISTDDDFVTHAQLAIADVMVLGDPREALSRIRHIQVWLEKQISMEEEAYFEPAADHGTPAHSA